MIMGDSRRTGGGREHWGEKSKSPPSVGSQPKAAQLLKSIGINTRKSAGKGKRARAAETKEASSSLVEFPRRVSKRAKQAAPIITKDNCIAIEIVSKALIGGGGEEVTDSSCRRSQRIRAKRTQE